MLALRFNQMAVGSPHTSAIPSPISIGGWVVRRQERAVSPLPFCLISSFSNAQVVSQSWKSMS